MSRYLRVRAIHAQPSMVCVQNGRSLSCVSPHVSVRRLEASAVSPIRRPWFCLIAAGSAAVLDIVAGRVHCAHNVLKDER